MRESCRLSSVICLSAVSQARLWLNLFSMPKVSEFFGIQITFNYRGEHNPPHFHAWHAGREGVFAIRLLAYLYGDLSPRAVALVTEWAMLHEDELLGCWRSAREMKPLPTIEPLS